MALQASLQELQSAQQQLAESRARGDRLAVEQAALQEALGVKERQVAELAGRHQVGGCGRILWAGRRKVGKLWAGSFGWQAQDGRLRAGSLG